MRWKTFSLLRGADIAKVVQGAQEQLYAVSTSGKLAEIDVTGGQRTIADAGGSISDLIYDDATDSLCLAGGAKVYLWGDGRMHVDEMPSSARLNGAACIGPSEWIVAGHFSPLSGALFVGSLGRWHEVPEPLLTAALNTLVPDGQGGAVLAGHRGFLAYYRQDEVVPLASGTLHPLRTLSTVGDALWAGGGGWADMMPILLKVGAQGVEPLETAGGNRVIEGIAEREGAVWLAENRSDGKSWTGYVTLYGSKDGELATFPNHRVKGILALKDCMLIWGSGGLLAVSY